VIRPGSPHVGGSVAWDALSVIATYEQAWMNRVDRIVTCTAHIQETHEAGGSPDYDELDGQWLRWPGFIGSEYGLGVRVLGVANVHRGFRSKRFRTINPQRKHTPEHVIALDDAVRVTGQRAAGAIGDREYLDGLRPMYQLGLSGSWSVGDVFRAGLEALLPWSEEGMQRIAYANVSCCQIPEAVRIPNAATVTEEIQALCLKHHPLLDLTASLEPHVILCCSLAGYLHLKDSIDPSITLIHFSQRMGDRHLMADTRIGKRMLPAGTKKERWAHALRDHVAASDLND
jgi:hypothetical protein